MPIEKTLPVISKPISIKAQFDLTVEQVNLVGRFVAEMTKRCWSQKRYTGTYLGTFNSYSTWTAKKGKEKTERGIEKLAEGKSELYGRYYT